MDKNTNTAKLMRNNDTWLTMGLPKTLKKFSKRLQEDLQSIPTPKKLKVENLYIYGPVGSGKTVFAAFIMLEAATRRYLNASNETIEMAKTSELIHEIKKSYGSNQQISEGEIIDYLSGVDVLVIDDFGNERPTDWILQILYLLIDRRYESMLTTIFTSNHSLEEIADKFGDDRIPSRIERMCRIIHKTKY